MNSSNNRNAFKKLLGDEIFFNKIDTKPDHREQALEHSDDCECNVCKIEALRGKVRLDKRTNG